MTSWGTNYAATVPVPSGWNVWLVSRAYAVADMRHDGRIPLACLHDADDGGQRSRQWVNLCVPVRWYAVLRELRELRRHRGDEGLPDASLWLLLVIARQPVTLDAWEVVLASAPLQNANHTDANRTHPALPLIPRGYDTRPTVCP